mgnify:CR=1 FL=1
MPKPYTFPTLYDDVLQLSITKLKQWKYLGSEHIKSGTITWSSNGNSTGKISIRVNTLCSEPYIELDYRYGGEPRKYKVPLVCVPSNLGKGYLWYFLCPQTHKRCRKLYSIGGYFLHREAFNGCMYETQTFSKSARESIKGMSQWLKTEKLYDQLFEKHFKKTYAGKPTKKYLRIMNK